MRCCWRSSPWSSGKHYDGAKATTEAGTVRDVYYVSLGFSDQDKSLLRDGILGYVESVVRVEWPAQAREMSVATASPWLNELNAGAVNDIRQAMLSLSLMRLSDTREQRLIAADTTVPAVIWIVTLMGGALAVALASLLGFPSLGMHRRPIADTAPSATFTGPWATMQQSLR